MSRKFEDSCLFDILFGSGFSLSDKGEAEEQQGI